MCVYSLVRTLLGVNFSYPGVEGTGERNEIVGLSPGPDGGGTSLDTVEGWGRVSQPAVSCSARWSSVLLVQPRISPAVALLTVYLLGMVGSETGWVVGGGGL